MTPFIGGLCIGTILGIALTLLVIRLITGPLKFNG